MNCKSLVWFSQTFSVIKKGFYAFGAYCVHAAHEATASNYKKLIAVFQFLLWILTSVRSDFALLLSTPQFDCVHCDQLIIELTNSWPLWSKLRFSVNRNCPFTMSAVHFSFICSGKNVHFLKHRLDWVSNQTNEPSNSCSFKLNWLKLLTRNVQLIISSRPGLKNFIFCGEKSFTLHWNIFHFSSHVSKYVRQKWVSEPLHRKN